MELIPDEVIPAADPEAVIRQYRPLVCKLARRYEAVLSRTGAIDIDDLQQIGFIAVCEAQKHYDPASGSFIGYASLWIRSAMRKALGFNSNTGEPPEALVYIDAPVPDTEGITLADTIPDSHPTREEELIDQASRDEVAEAVRDAVDRIKNRRFREAITRIWLYGQDKQTAADEMGIAMSALRNYDRKGRDDLMRDKRLQMLAFPLFTVGVSTFHTTMTSAVEKAVLWREKQYDRFFGDGSFAGSHKKQDPDE